MATVMDEELLSRISLIGDRACLGKKREATDASLFDLCYGDQQCTGYFSVAVIEYNDQKQLLRRV